MEIAALDTQVIVCNYATHSKPFQTGRLLSHYLFRLQMEGTSEVELNGNKYVMMPRDLIICRPGDDYKLRINMEPNAKLVRSRDYYLYCRGEWVNQWCKPEYPSKFHIGADDQIISLFKNLIYERRDIVERDPDIQDYMTRLLLLAIGRLLRNGTSKTPLQFVPYRMKRYIEEKATESITLHDVAGAVGLGVSRASELFKSTFKQSVMDYAIEVRLTIAQERMLYEGLSLEEVAYASGFNTYSHFSRTFASRFGISPKEYRATQNIEKGSQKR
jgi:AraC family transcriptional regulator of arabinose operon